MSCGDLEFKSRSPAWQAGRQAGRRSLSFLLSGVFRFPHEKCKIQRGAESVFLSGQVCTEHMIVHFTSGIGTLAVDSPWSLKQGEHAGSFLSVSSKVSSTAALASLRHACVMDGECG